jgi:hypothetical protein
VGVLVSPAPPIFVGPATSPTNIGHVYSSVMCRHQRIYEARQSLTGRAIYSLVPDQTNKYNLYSSVSGTNEYNLNIFVGIDTDEYIGTDE